MNKNIIVSIIILAVVVIGGYIYLQPTSKTSEVERVTDSRIWSAKGSEGLIIGGYGDNFVYDGNGVIDVVGNFNINVDSKNETGKVEVELPNATHQTSKDTTLSGNIKLVLTFSEEDAHTHADDSMDEMKMEEKNNDSMDDMEAMNNDEMQHAMGLQPFMQGGVAELLYLHGDSGQGPPVMPKVWTYLAGWGDLDIFVDDKLVYDDLMGHFMITEQARRDNKIVDEDGIPYNPERKAESGFTNPDKTEFHIVAHSMKSDENNFPPDADLIHLNFQKVIWASTPDEISLEVPR